jgi:hypothetical protein
MTEKCPSGGGEFRKTKPATTPEEKLQAKMRGMINAHLRKPMPKETVYET